MEKRVNIWRLLAIVLIVILVFVGIAWHQGLFEPLTYRPSNAIMVLAPYRHAGTWVFDDARVGLRQEPFVAGVPEMIDEMVKDIPDANEGFRLFFSTGEFPGYTHTLTWRRGDATGNWYYCEQVDKEGWLCPALFKYYKRAPEKFYIKAEAK